MYFYDTRKGKDEKKRLPKDGWFFPCISCRIITGSNVNYPYKKNFFFFDEYVKIPCCKKCLKYKKFSLDDNLFYKIN